ncbi:Family of serine hydrolases 3 [Madurella fahalii]|uniref:Family of serine hydrolases 3 n=1 Tax=Madurella fahalii TaxID=1157608 RepID=A0ABQ0G418_9PEZI
MGDNRDTPQPPSRADSPSVRAAANSKNANTKTKKEIRILMLHGYTQSGALFRAKTRALEKLLAKALAPLGLVPALLYPTAPNRLSPRDIPGYEPSGPNDEGGETEEATDSWAWFRKDEASGTYRLVEEGMRRLAEAVTELRGGGGGGADGADGDGGFVDGVIGFSQGGCMAAMLASAMECGRAPRTVGAAKEHEGWAKAVREANGGRPLKFAVIYSGFYAVPADLGWLYEPKVKTSTLHFLGSLDTVVDESRSQGLIERCEEPMVMVHPGGHYVPVSKEWVMPLAGFIRKCLEEDSMEAK